jgi:hypothetical protein
MAFDVLFWYLSLLKDWWFPAADLEFSQFSNVIGER